MQCVNLEEDEVRGGNKGPNYGNDLGFDSNTESRWKVRILVSYRCITNHHKLSGLKHTHIYYLTVSVGQHSGPGLHVFCASKSHKALFTVLARLHSSWRLDWGRIHFRAHSGC